MWAVRQYRECSPGERLIEEFRKRVPFLGSESLIDCGCGTGRAAVKLSNLGLRVTLLDICEQALDPQVRNMNVPFVEACLWETPKVGGFDWFYCTDVMEHIPPEHVEAVLANIRAMTSKGGFFQIAMFEEGFGDFIGETLHLTIKNENWWISKLLAHWAIDWIEVKDRRLIAICLPMPRMAA